MSPVSSSKLSRWDILLGSVLSLVIVLQAVTAVSIPKNRTTAAGHGELWKMDIDTGDPTDNSLEVNIFSKLREFAISCCFDIWAPDLGKPDDEAKQWCNEKQMAGWAWFPVEVTAWTEAEEILNDFFNPRNSNLNKRELCRVDYDPDSCPEEPNEPGGEIDYPLYAYSIPECHSEEYLFFQMQERAIDMTLRFSPVNFYLWTTQNPCAGDQTPGSGGSCTEDIFHFAVNYNHDDPLGFSGFFHTMNVGFRQWVTGAGLEDNRDKFCDKVDSLKWNDYPDYDFSDGQYGQGLSFTKFFTQINDETWDPDSRYNDGRDHC